MLGGCRLFITLSILVWALTISGCGDSGPKLPPTSEWVTFESDLVSLDLPDSFVGGDPREPAVMASLQDRAASNPNPAARQELDSYLSDIGSAVKQPGIERRGWLLVVWGEADSDGNMPEITVNRLNVAGELLARTRGDASMEALVQAMMYRWRQSEWTVQQMTEERAYVVALHLKEEPGDWTERQYVIFRVAGGYMYEFSYSYLEEANAYLDSVFKQSAEAAIVKGYDEEPQWSDAGQGTAN